MIILYKKRKLYTSRAGKIMGKHHDKIKKALEQRIAATPNGSGYKKPGSMNKKKTGYRGQTAKGSK
jgi:hypothetical protein